MEGVVVESHGQCQRELAQMRAEIIALRERMDSLEATIDVLSDPVLMAQLQESRASLAAGERTYTLEEVEAERAARRHAQAHAEAAAIARDASEQAELREIADTFDKD